MCDHLTLTASEYLQLYTRSQEISGGPQWNSVMSRDLCSGRGNRLHVPLTIKKQRVRWPP